MAFPVLPLQEEMFPQGIEYFLKKKSDYSCPQWIGSGLRSRP